MDRDELLALAWLGDDWRAGPDMPDHVLAVITPLREALSDILTRFEPWSPDDYIADKAARAALGEAK